LLWRELNAESNKLAVITAEDTLVHRDKDMTTFAAELEDMGELDDIEYIDEDEIEDIEDIEELEDFEYTEE
jgi:GTP-binding protein